MRTHSLFTAGVLTALLVMGMLLCSAATHAAKKDIKGQLSQQKDRAADQRALIEKLTEKERKLHADLAAAEAALKKQARSLSGSEKELLKLERKEQKASKELELLNRKKRLAMADLTRLLQGLWTVQMQRAVSKGRDISSWADSDRSFTWLQQVYAASRAKLAAVATQEARVRSAMTKQHQLVKKVRSALSGVNVEKNKLLADSLKFQKRLKELRKQKQSAEADLNDILKVINKLNYKLAHPPEKPKQVKIDKSSKIAKMKGKLPWPAKGKIVVSYNLKKDPPSRGLGLSLPEGEPIHAVAWGQVVHDDVLRGFGRVVIMTHPGNYYSLYAYLSESNVKMGQELGPGDQVGRAGYYPRIKGPGVYFELRFKQKPINPKVWLSAQK